LLQQIDLLLGREIIKGERAAKEPRDTRERVQSERLAGSIERALG